MPLYEYRCRECGARFELLRPLGAGTEGLSCPECGAREGVEKQFSTFGAGGSRRAAGNGGGGSRGGGCSSGFG